MMTVIHKYPLVIADVQQITMPYLAKILTVAMQRGQPCIWAEVDPGYKSEVRTIRILGTGHEMLFDRNLYDYIGTVLMAGDYLVWHVYAERK